MKLSVTVNGIEIEKKTKKGIYIEDQPKMLEFMPNHVKNVFFIQCFNLMGKHVEHTLNSPYVALYLINRFCFGLMLNFSL